MSLGRMHGARRCRNTVYACGAGSFRRRTGLSKTRINPEDGGTEIKTLPP